jgi:hypothetical protein
MRYSKVIHIAKKEGLSVEQIVKLLQLADESNAFRLSSLEMVQMADR